MGRGREGVLHRFVRLAELDPLALFVSVDGATLTRRQFLNQTGKAAGALAISGIGPGDVVVICTPNRVEWCVAFWACVAIGAVPAPLDPATGIWEMRQLLQHLSPQFAIANASFRAGDPSSRIRQVLPHCPMVVFDERREGAVFWSDFLADAPCFPLDKRLVNEDDLLLFACTSGTIGNPKILAIPHLGFLKSQADMAAYLNFGPHDQVLLGMPLYHQGGFGMSLQALVAGSHALFAQTFGPKAFLDQLCETRSTVAQLSPTLAKLILTVPDIDRRDFSDWRMAYFAGEVLPDDLAERFWRDLSIRTINVVGSSETGTMLVWDSLTDSDRSASDLSTLPFTQARILDPHGIPTPEGEPGILWIHTDALLSRYEANPTLTASSLQNVDGLLWFCTGDLVRQLPDGRIRFLGRAKRVVKRGPNLVHPEEIEAFLMSHPSIAGIAIGKEVNEVFGESLIAWIQPEPGTELCRTDIVKFCRDQISSYKIPDQMHFVKHLPTDQSNVQNPRRHDKGPT